MFFPYIKHLIDSLPKECKDKYNNTISLDIVLEGGLFNGSYLSGCLLYLKELEKIKYIKINKLSGCSIGSIGCILYFIEDETVMMEIYKLAYNQLKQNYNINVFHSIFTLLKSKLPSDIIKRINHRLYISYYNVKTGKRTVKNTYKNIEELFETIRRSCSFPYVIDNVLYYKNKYIDGLYPHIFTAKDNTNNSNNIIKSKVLYLNIHNLNQIFGMISVKNELTNSHRILEGIIDIHVFFIKNSKTNICSFIENWSYLDWLRHYYFVYFMEIGIWVLNKIYIFSSILSTNDKEVNLYKTMHNMYIYLLKNYCI